MTERRRLKVAIACGGTGGHIFPGLATAYELMDRGHETTLWLAGKDVEKDAVKGWTGRVVTIPAEGFSGGGLLRTLRTAWRLRRAYRTALGPMRESRPDVLLCMGSYASYGPARAARKVGVPYVMHEANLVPGRAVSLLSRKAAAVATSFEKSTYYLKHGRVVHTGMPLRRALREAASARTPAARPADAPMRILAMGGSRGAHVLNETVPRAIAAAVEKGMRADVTHIAGLSDSDAVRAIYDAAGVPARVRRFADDMAEVYLNADFAVCRSGAATCAELAAFGVPALLVPYPHAVRNHQMSNARALQDAGAADVVAQEDLTASWLSDYLLNVSSKPERRERMTTALIKRAQLDAAARLADSLESVATGTAENAEE